MDGRLFDLFVIGFLILQTFLGWRRGLLWQAASVASILFGLLLGVLFAPALADVLTEHVTSNLFRAKIIAFLFIIGTVGFTFRLLAALAEVYSETGVPKKERERRRADDRILGGIFGAVKGSVLCLVVIAAAVSLWPGASLWQQSSLAEPLAVAGSRLLPSEAVHEVRRWAARSAQHVQHELDLR